MYPRKPFREFLDEFKWRQGEHVLIAAPTQTGKSTLASHLVHNSGRQYVTVLANKPRDDNLARRYRDFKRVDMWDARKMQGVEKVILWPKTRKTHEETIEAQRLAHKTYLDWINRITGYCTVVDEYHWEAQMLRLDKVLAALHHQGSASGNTMVTLTQRPAWIPRITYSSVTHAFIGKTSDRDDLKSLSQFGGLDSREVMGNVQQIGRHDLLYLNPMGDSPPVVINTRK